MFPPSSSYRGERGATAGSEQPHAQLTLRAEAVAPHPRACLETEERRRHGSPSRGDTLGSPKAEGPRPAQGGAWASGTGGRGGHPTSLGSVCNQCVQGPHGPGSRGLGRMLLGTPQGRKCWGGTQAGPHGLLSWGRYQTLGHRAGSRGGPQQGACQGALPQRVLHCGPLPTTAPAEAA